MRDEALESLRRIMIDNSLDRGDRELFYKLTGLEWQQFVLNDDPNCELLYDDFSFLDQEVHFWDKRIYEDVSHRTYINYRYREWIADQLYVGEIKIPLGWSGEIITRFRSRPARTEPVNSPQWFQTLSNIAADRNRISR